jgi:hypothetical protein
LEHQNLRRQTIVLLAILNYNYWCDSEEEKEKIHEELITNNEIREKELAEKYNPDNMFKKKNEVKEQTTVDAPNIQLVEYKEQGFIKKLLNKLMRLFKK